MNANPLVQIDPPRPRLPEWARKPATHFETLHALKVDLRRLNLRLSITTQVPIPQVIRQNEDNVRLSRSHELLK